LGRTKISFYPPAFAQAERGSDEDIDFESGTGDWAIGRLADICPAIMGSLNPHQNSAV
jgi:hypothetical protein